MINIIGLQKKYGKKEILHNITLELQNTTYGLVGANGAGKTTLIRILAGIIAPSEGRVMVNGQKDAVGYLPQKFGCFPEITVYEQMQYFACLKKLPENMQKDEIDKVLLMVNLNEQKNVRCNKLSGGMVRRVGIAQALMGSPQLLLLDEPTVGLDFEERKRFNQIIQKLEGKMTILLSTHLIEDINNVCKKVILIQNGQVKQIEDVNGASAIL